MIGAIAGDIIGSVFEHQPAYRRDFELFQARSCYTDDTVLTIAVADALLNDRPYDHCLLEWGQRFPQAGYGRSFMNWLRGRDDPVIGNSWGNGAAMRVSPVGWAFDSEAEVLAVARASAEVTHGHAEGIKGAQATALAIFLARHGAGKPEIRQRMIDTFGYDLDRSLADIQPGYAFDVSAAGSVPEAMIAFLEADSFEQAVRNAVWLGGDADTQACIAGAIAEAHFGGVPADIASEVMGRLPDDLLQLLKAFYSRFNLSPPVT